MKRILCVTVVIMLLGVCAYGQDITKAPDKPFPSPFGFQMPNLPFDSLKEARLPNIVLEEQFKYSSFRRTSSYSIQGRETSSMSMAFRYLKGLTKEECLKLFDKHIQEMMEIRNYIADYNGQSFSDYIKQKGERKNAADAP